MFGLANCLLFLVGFLFLSSCSSYDEIDEPSNKTSESASAKDKDAKKKKNKIIKVSAAINQDPNVRPELVPEVSGKVHIFNKKYFNPEPPTEEVLKTNGTIIQSNDDKGTEEVKEVSKKAPNIKTKKYKSRKENSKK